MRCIYLKGSVQQKNAIISGTHLSNGPHLNSDTSDRFLVNLVGDLKTILEFL